MSVALLWQRALEDRRQEQMRDAMCRHSRWGPLERPLAVGTQLGAWTVSKLIGRRGRVKLACYCGRSVTMSESLARRMGPRTPVCPHEPSR